MSETTQTGSQEAVSDEDRVIAMFGLDDDGENTADHGDDGEADQPEQGAAPEEDSDQPETEDDGDNPPDDVALIDPPVSLAKEFHEHWANVPPPLAKAIAELDNARTLEVRRSQTERAEAVRQAQQIAGEVAQERAYLQQHLLPALQEVNKRLQVDYSPEAMAELARTNPAQWAEKVAERDRLGAMQQAMQAEQQRTDALVIQGEMQRLAEAAPEIRDQKVGTKVLEDWAGTAMEHGFTQREMAEVKDHRVFLVLRDLHQTKQKLAEYEKARAAPVKNAVRNAPNRAPTNAGRPRPETGNQVVGRRQIMQAARSGDERSQIAAVEAMFGLKG